MSVLPVRAILIASLLLTATAVPAHDGEDHGAPVEPLSVAGSATRAATASEAFEAVAVLAGGRLHLFLDRYDSNAPVTGARVEIDSDLLKGVAAETTPGIYTLPAPSLAAGKHGLTITVETKDTADLLLLALDVPELVGADVGVPVSAWRTVAVSTFALLLAVVAVVVWRPRVPGVQRA